MLGQNIEIPLGECISAVRILEFTVHESLRKIGVRTPTNYRPTTVGLLQACILCQPVLQVRKVYCTPWLKKQEMWANAHEMRNSISLISDEGCRGLSPVISAKIHFKCASQPEIAKKITKNPYFRGWGLSMLVPPERSSSVLVMTSSKSVYLYSATVLMLDELIVVR